MKKLVIAVLFVLAVVGMASAVDYGSNTLGLSGKITKTASVSITGVAGVYNLLNLSSTSYSSTKLKVADASVTTNMKAWTLTATSANAWKFINGALAEEVAYKLWISPDAGTTYIDGTAATYTGTAKGTKAFTLSVTYDAAGTTLTSDDAYTDTVTLTVSAS